MSPEASGHESQGAAPGAGSGDAALEQLTRALPRPAPDPETRARVLRHVQAAFDVRTRRGQRRRIGLSFAAAAAVVVCALSLVVFDALHLKPTEPPSIAHLFTIDTLQGEVLVLHADARQSRVAIIGNSVAAGGQIRSAAGASVSLRSPQGMQVRLAGESTLHFEVGGGFALEEGRVYFDTDAVRDVAAKQLRIGVGEAQIENLGTRFSVARQGATLTVAVLSGSVRWTQGRDGASVLARERLQVHAGRVISRTPLGDPDVEFDWVLAAAAFPPSGAPINEVVTWYADQTGRRLRLAPGVDRLLAQRVEGTSRAHTPAQRVQALLAAAGLSFSASDGVLDVDCLDRRDCVR